MSQPKPAILIADGSPENIHLLADLLADVARILFTRTGRGVYPLLEQHTIDMILLEANLPDISGFEICQRLMNDRHHRHIRILFITSRDEPEDQNLGLSLGAMDYITKPIAPVSLRYRILNHLKQVHLRHELTALITRDPLTGLGHRKLFFEQLASELATCQRQQRQCSLIVFDLDHFKRINRSFGGMIADSVLIQTTRMIQEQIPASARFYRLGDDEFAVLLPDIGLDSSRLLAEHLRLSIQENQHATGTDQFVLTACFGVATAYPGEVYSNFHLRVDAALQTAKKKGRNRVDVA
jgi:diguanylate cyclase (GGDEF)-like protein